MKTTYEGRSIEIIKPNNRYGACVFTINGHGPREGERFTAALGQDASDVLRMITRNIDETDAKGVRGPSEFTVWLRPGSFEVCVNGRGGAYGEHVKPVDGPCLEDKCKKAAAKKAEQAARRKEAHPAVAALTTQLKKAGFAHHGNGYGRPAGFRVMKNEGGAETGVRVIWYREGGNMPIYAAPGSCPEIAEHITAADRYAVRYTGGCTVYVVSKTHGRFPDYA